MIATHRPATKALTRAEHLAEHDREQRVFKMISDGAALYAAKWGGK